MTLKVSNTAALVGSEDAKIAVGRAISKKLQVDEENVIVNSITAARRLAAAEVRRLAAGDVNVDYTVLIDEDSSTDVEADSASIVSKIEAMSQDTSDIKTLVAVALVEEDIQGVTVDELTASATVTVEEVTTSPPPVNPSASSAHSFGLATAVLFAVAAAFSHVARQ